MTNRDPNIQEEHRAGRPRAGSDDSTPDIPEESTGRADEVAPSAPRWRKDSGRPTFEVADVVYEPMVVPELPPSPVVRYGALEDLCECDHRRVNHDNRMFGCGIFVGGFPCRCERFRKAAPCPA